MLRNAHESDVSVILEIADATLAMDLGDKLRDYARAKIADYLVVDLQGEVVHHCTEPRESAYAARRIIRFGEPIELPGQQFTIAAPRCLVPACDGVVAC
jgi:Uma2 family endonuclease